MPELDISQTTELPEGQGAYEQIFIHHQEEQVWNQSYLLRFQNHYIDIYSFRRISQIRIEPEGAVGIHFANFDRDDEYEMAFLSEDAFTYYDLGRHSVEADNEFVIAPNVIFLNPAYPNPFNGSVTIPYRMPIPGNVNITVYDSFGREVAILTNDFKSKGSHQIRWTPKSVPSGTYIVRVGLANSVSMVPVTLVK